MHSSSSLVKFERKQTNKQSKAKGKKRVSKYKENKTHHA
jgi:hypothetical protein